MKNADFHTARGFVLQKMSFTVVHQKNSQTPGFNSERGVFSEKVLYVQQTETVTKPAALLKGHGSALGRGVLSVFRSDLPLTYNYPVMLGW